MSSAPTNAVPTRGVSLAVKRRLTEMPTTIHILRSSKPLTNSNAKHTVQTSTHPLKLHTDHQTLSSTQHEEDAKRSTTSAAWPSFHTSTFPQTPKGARHARNQSSSRLTWCMMHWHSSISFWMKRGMTCATVKVWLRVD